MIAIELIVLFGAAFVFGYLVGKTGRTDADKAKQEVEDAAMAFGHAEIKVEDGNRVFRWKTKK
jgi:cytochrome oxidase Cu insertion factor (SCO1/SenC/PrrC family)